MPDKNKSINRRERIGRTGRSGDGVDRATMWCPCNRRRRLRSTMLRTSALEYDLPERLIAINPIEPREDAKLLVVQRSDPSRIEHCRVADLPGLMPSDAVAVFNRTRVLPARFVGVNIETGGRIEGLWLADGLDDRLVWHAFVRARRLRAGRLLALVNADGERTGVVLRLRERISDDGVWVLEVEDERRRPTPEILRAFGQTPLPPYIRSARKRAGVIVADEVDRCDYQTVYAAKGDTSGHWSVAAPTAGLHFSQSGLTDLERRGVRRAEVMLDVGAGTFKPIEAEHVEDHPMHAEWCSLGESHWVMDAQKPVIAVGSTSARTLESFAIAASQGIDPSEWLETDLMIAPGYEWKRVDGLLTNFHLPRSTLLLMVAAFLPGGIEQLMALYTQAIEREYRFFSYGDAMLILP